MPVGVSSYSLELRAASPQQDRLPGAPGAPDLPKGGESIVTFTDLVAYLRARFNVEEGQTMAEYGVVLAVITGLVVIAIGLHTSRLIIAL